MRFYPYPLAAILVLAGCASTPTEIKRLSPVLSGSKAPAQCRVISIVKDSPAEKGGLVVGDILKSVNGKVPLDASSLSDIVGTAKQDSDFEVTKQDGSIQHVTIHLNANRPRLGSVCDLGGWEKPGVTAAGNESVTVFSGPFALTASGIIDKEVGFLRVRLSNNTDKPLEVGPDLFTATDGSGTSLPILSPKDVMCFLYGDNGAHMLELKKKHKETLDAQESIPAAQGTPDEHCPWGTKGHMAHAETQFVEANATYMATESLWPSTYQPGTVADGLIYVKEPPSLPLTLTATVQGQTLVAKLGHPVASDKIMTRAELIQFFAAQKKGTGLRLTLRKGQVFVGKFNNYDDIGERVWFDTPSSTVLYSSSYSIDNIRNAQTLEQLPAKTTPTSTDLN